ncbi:MAG: glutathione S-transferase family protein [Thermoleophilia bacterium]|nr:glutathione S-transferase family protein [Thermoleophilia bacterium]
MPTTEKITLHVLPPSHPCMTAKAALEHKGLEYDLVALDFAGFGDRMEEIYGPGNRTVPGLVFGDEPIHGSAAILERLEQLVPENPLYPEPIAGMVREAELWAEGDLQDSGRCLTWGAIHFRPEALGTFSGGGNLDPAGTDYAMKLIHATWKYHRITAVRIAEDLQRLPGMVARIEGFADQGLIDGDTPTAADLQIGATIRVMLSVGDLLPVFEGTAAERVARRFFPDYDVSIPAGALPAGWVVTEVPAAG